MGDRDLDDIWAFDVKSSTWKQIQYKGEAPCPRSFHKMTSAGGKLFVFGGCSSSGRMSDLYCFDPKTSKRSKLPSSDKIKGRGGAVFESSPDGNSLFVVAGFTGEESSDVHRFDIASKKWT